MSFHGSVPVKQKQIDPSDGRIFFAERALGRSSFWLQASGGEPPAVPSLFSVFINSVLHILPPIFSYIAVLCHFYYLTRGALDTNLII